MPSKSPLFTILSLGAVIALTMFATLAFTLNRPSQPLDRASAPVMGAPGAPASVPPFRPAPAASGSAVTLSTTLSYAFIPSQAFTADSGLIDFQRQVNGCVNYMPLGYPFSAPVYLPQASQVVSITLFTYNSVLTPTISTATFLYNDGMGGVASTLSVDSLPNTIGYQQVTSTMDNPLTVANQSYGLWVQWRTSGVDPAPLLGLCGVRVAYYAPAGATFLPLLSNP